MHIKTYAKTFTLLKRLKVIQNTCHYASTGCIDLKHKDLTVDIKHKIEHHWQNQLGSNRFDPSKPASKFYVLSMFPYPSGNLHMGHVRVYTISDAMARFYRMNGYNVLHPMGWDAFGLPAENAAIERNIPADKWTQQNIEHMKDQLNAIGCSFDWSREVATCRPDYYRWTQNLFLKMYKAGLAYQKEALVNWDPIDKTVLADEQVDANQCSWRSGAKVEKKLLKQWFIRTTKFAKDLLDGLNDPGLVDWRDIINLQRHWIGECNGYCFDLPLKRQGTESSKRLKQISVWTKHPEHMPNAAFIAIKPEHILSQEIENSTLKVEAINVFNGNRTLPVIITAELEYPESCDTYIGLPAFNELDKNLAEKHKIPFNSNPNPYNSQAILDQAIKENIGGYLVSSKLKDWLISRQRYWGTPIPIIHCDSCGAVPVDESDLPVLLPSSPADWKSALKAICPKCKNTNARRESDTMDTFVDSSWYFLRYLDANNETEMFDRKLTQKLMPVDLYIGGKEHAVLHMYYARFVNRFLYSIGLTEHPEPFQRLLIQGMVMGRSYRVKGSGKYLRENEVKVINEKKNQAIEVATGNPVVMQWEKMSKSKQNGVDPAELIKELSCDTVRLILLGDVAPTSHRNWSRTTFPGLLNWQKRLWLTLNQFHAIRSDESWNEPELKQIIETQDFVEKEEKMFDARNYYIKGTTFNYKYSHQLSVAISKMQGLTNSIRRAPKELIRYGKEYELALANLLMMMSPMAPHFASELWSQFLLAPNRLNIDNNEIDWNSDVLQQRWPIVHQKYKLDLGFKVNGMDLGEAKYTMSELESVTHQQALEVALNNEAVQSAIGDKPVIRTNYVHYPGCSAIISIYFEKFEKKERNVEKQ